jgi:dTDP-4-dehydrorhamnose reductase
MLRILLLGKNGQLGWELNRALAPLGSIQAVDYPEIDLTQPETLRPLIKAAAPQIIVNATAYTAVDRAESEPELAYAINETAVQVMAEEAERLGAGLIHYSTDYVFDGAKGGPYTEKDTPNPLSVYGKSKLAGENAIQNTDAASLILRTSWVYSLRRDSFVTKVLQWARQKPSLAVVTDQVGNPTWARMLAETCTLLLAGAGDSPVDYLHQRSGLYHLAGSGYASRLEWAEAILRLDSCANEQVVTELIPARTADFPAPAERPLFSALDCRRFTNVFDLRLPDWQAALELAMEPL